MTTNRPETLVAIYSSSVEFEAEMVKSMLADNEISAVVENANGPFPGIAAVPCQVFVSVENEPRARELIEEHEARLRERADEDDVEDEESEINAE